MPKYMYEKVRRQCMKINSFLPSCRSQVIMTEFRSLGLRDEISDNYFKQNKLYPEIYSSCFTLISGSKIMHKYIHVIYISLMY